MHISEKIDLRKYTFLSLVLLAISYYLSKNNAEVKVILTIFLAACLNQWMLVRGVQKLVGVAASSEKADKAGLMTLFVGKAIVLIIAITFGVQIMGKRIIIPVLIYVLQIGVLYFSMKKTVEEQGTNK